MGFLKTIVNRWSHETPEFFKRLRFISILFLIISFGIIFMNYLGFKMYETIIVISKFVMSSSTTLGITSQLTQTKCSEEV